jgi:hypothetical protein
MTSGVIEPENGTEEIFMALQGIVWVIQAVPGLAGEFLARRNPSLGGEFRPDGSAAGRSSWFADLCVEK